MDKKRVCGTCKYHQFESVNDESEYLSDWMDFNHSCDAREEREE